MKKLLLILCFVFSISTTMGCCIALHNPSHPQNQLVDHLNQSTVELVQEVIPGTGMYHTYCSGFWISEYHMVTARHCVTDMNDKVKINSIITFTTYKEFSNKYPPPSPKKVYAAVIVASKKNVDLVVLKTIDDVDHHILNISKHPIPVGSRAHIVGHPVQMKYSYMTGVVSQVRRFNLPDFNKKVKVLHITSLVNRGNSGCAVVDDGGNVIGISSFLRLDVPGMAMFIHKDELTKLLDKEEIKYY